MLCRVAVELPQSSFVEISLRHASDEHRARRRALCVVWRRQVRLPQVDVVNAFSADRVQDEAEKCPGYKQVGKKPLRIGNVANGEQIELFIIVAAGGVDGEQNGPYDDAAG